MNTHEKENSKSPDEIGSKMLCVIQKETKSSKLFERFQITPPFDRSFKRIKHPKRVVDLSVLACNYNNADYLDDFFISLSQSSVQPKEIVFVDDGSTDSSLKIIEKYKQIPHLKPILLNHNIGRAASLNFGKQQCTSKYTLIIDPDDIMLPDRIETQFNFMEANKDIDILGGNVLYFNHETKKFLFRSNFTDGDIVQRLRTGESSVLQPTIIIKTKVYKALEYRNLVPGQDYDLFSRLAMKGYRLHNLHQTLNLMRVHPGSATSRIGYNAIERIFNSRDQIFGTSTSQIKKRLYYLYIRNYKNAMLATHPISKYTYLAIAAMARPQKLFKRFAGRFLN